MPEEIEPQPEEVVEEEPKVSFFDKIKVHKFKILAGALGVFVLAGAVFGAYKLAQLRQVQTERPCGPCPMFEIPPGFCKDGTLIPGEIDGCGCESPPKCQSLTADWKTYTNTEYGYSIKYPNDFIHKVEVSTGDGLKIPYYGEIFYKDDDQVRLSIMKLLDVSQLDRENKAKELEGASLSLADYKELEIDGQRVIVYKSKNLSGQIEASVAEIVSKQNGRYIKIRGWGEDFFNLMLSTFRFLEEESCGEMTLSEAEEIALESKCVEKGGLKEEHFCNQNTGTWWIDLDVEKEGCNPACVISISTGEAEINWRCTGLIPSGGKVFCEDPRPQVCTMECIVNPPYICGSDGKSYCSECQACANSKVEWYLIQDTPCGT